jgi:hypothetical protein
LLRNPLFVGGTNSRWLSSYKKAGIRLLK